MSRLQIVLRALLLSAVSVALFACAAKPRPDQRAGGAKDIFFFFDGTGNTASTQTNVRRTYESISDASQKGTITFYMQGVGDPRHPITGLALGKGMNDRIESMYAELLKIYKPGDRVYVYGFSRGALMARAFAGLVSYAGVPKLKATPRTPEDYRKIAEDINDVVKGVEDEKYGDDWKRWAPGATEPVLAAVLAEKIPLLRSEVDRFYSVEIELLGVWDTVPGSARKKYSSCIEEVGGTEGTRYKTNSYPPIKRIAHAASIDEKRDRFQLLRVCEPIQPTRTIVVERFFPGAHSDVGGGYDEEEGSKGLSDISLKWMFGQLELTHYQIPELKLQPNPLGVAHWSLSGFVNVLMNNCEDRAWRTKPDGVPKPEEDESFGKRVDEKTVNLLPPNRTPYQITCAGHKNGLQ